MIDHIGLKVRSYAKSKEFYLKALAPIGYELVMEFGPIGGFGANKKPDYWIAEGEPGQPIHVCFAGDRKQVDAFYRAALEAGGKDNGAPGLRTQYHPSYYGAFVLDPDGNNVEVCCHVPA